MRRSFKGLWVDILIVCLAISLALIAVAAIGHFGAHAPRPLALSPSTTDPVGRISETLSKAAISDVGNLAIDGTELFK